MGVDSGEQASLDARDAAVSDVAPTSPVVSVLIPVYNGARYLAATIESVLSQTFGDFELVISDDASSDDSLATIRSFNDPRIRLVTNTRNLGFGGNWNRVLGEARGEFIKLLPQDDLLHPECLARQLDALRGRPATQVALVFSARRIIDPSGKTVFQRGLGKTPKTLDQWTLLQRAARSGTNPIGEPGAVLFPRHLAQKIGAFDGTRPFVIDLDYWLRLLAYGNALYIPATLSAFRVSDQSHSVSLGTEQAREFGAFLETLGPRHGGPLPAGARFRGRLAARLQGFARMAFQRVTLLRAAGASR